MPKRKEKTAGPSRSMGDFILTCFACRDVWAAERASQNQEGIRDKGYAAFKKWVIEAFGREEPPQEVVEFLKLLVAPNDPVGYSAESLKILLKHRSNDRDYRPVVSGDTGSEDEDFRVRQFMEVLVHEKKKNGSHPSSSLSAWICPFFCNRKGLTFPQPRESTHATTQCSRIEQMLFLAAVARISLLVSSRRANKRRKVGSASTDASSLLPSVSSMNGVMGQRLGRGIQAVVTGWDFMARELGFESLEKLLMPYVRVTSSPVMYEVIDRADGFAPKSQQNSFELDVAPTLDREQTFAEAFDRTPELDGNIRRLLRMFLEEFYSVIEADALYDVTVWSHLGDYVPQGGNMPKRFERISEELLQGIAKSMKSQLRVSVMKAAVPKTPSPDVEESSSMEVEETDVSATDADIIASMATVRSAMKKNWRMMACSFDDLLEAHEQLYPREELAESVQFILTDPPYNIRRGNGSANASYDSLSVKQMDGVVDAFAELLRPGGHGIVFCTAQQFPLWEQKFNKHSSGVFSVDKTPIVLAWHPAVSKTFPGRRSCTLQNCVEFAIHVKKKGLKQHEEEEMVNYQNFNYVGSEYAGHKNVISKIWGLKPGEQVRITINGRVFALRNEQKPLALLMELICRFSQPGDIVVDFFGGTFSCCSACFLVERHRKFVGCELDVDCFNRAQEHVMQLFMETISNGCSDVQVAEEVKEAAVAVIKAQKRKKRNLEARWKAPGGLPQYQGLPAKLLFFLASNAEEPSLYFSYRKRGVHDWPRKFQGYLQQADLDVLRSLDATACDVIIGKSKIKCKHAGLGVFAAKTFSPEEIIGPFYGTLVYHNLLNRRELHKTYGEGVLATNAERFRNYAIQVPVSGSKFDAVRDLMDGKKAVSIVPARFCSMGLVNDYRYHPEDEEFEGNVNRRVANARFINTAASSIKSPEQLVDPFCQVVVATSIINPGDEIYVDYGNTYEVFVTNCG